MSGKSKEERDSAKKQHEIYNGPGEANDFTKPEFVEAWNRYLATIDSPNLKTTLSSIPEFDPSYRFVLKIENTVQEDNVRSIKPELVSFLRKELKNSTIEVVTKIVVKKGKPLIYSDDEKYSEMASKNPDLKLLRRKFNLDFGE